MRQPTILMCPPEYYGIEYEINPWMSRARGAVRETAQAQWRMLYETLLGLGVRVELLTPQPGLPDLVFTANAGLVFKNRFISSRFRHEVRARETPHFDAWFASHGFQVEHLPEGMYFEGAGDALFCGPILFAGYRIRSDALAHQEVGRMIGKVVLPLELVQGHFYHLDTCFCPLAPGEAIWYPPAFDAYAQRVIRSQIPRLIEVNDHDARRFGCNAVVIGRTVVVNTGCGQLTEDLEQAGYRVVTTPLDEFLKAGGSAKCLTLRLDGEEAAVWDG
ncbi:MAG: arginine deiminase-related protein [Gemmatales bacterium]|nr:arginine deiminase-related protein [Gemmatales bacterium]MDW8387283.1 arginine deiminase-related protein [Gemmatales bacterium]